MQSDEHSPNNVNMDPNFKEFLITDAKKWSGEIKTAILWDLKHNPEQLKSRITDNLADWATIYCLRTRQQIRCISIHLEAQELMEAYSELYKDELATMQ